VFDLTGRVALVTGAGQGIGAGIATALASQGAAVGVNDIDAPNAARTASEIEQAGGRAAASPFDVTIFEESAQGIARLVAELGPIDILVNNAGGTVDGMWPTPFLETPIDVWQPMVDLNLSGTLNCTRIVAEGMCERGWGRIITISSDAARLGSQGSSIYGAAKAGGEGLMRTLAKELGPKGVTANAIALGLIDTVPAEFLKQANAERRYAMRRVGTREDVAAGVVYLASPDAGWVTGHTLVINGGFDG
jgi:NAD(P)-dependent dehydrogenase (short-subunit alcohol dehydrogenase family)